MNTTVKRFISIPEFKQENNIESFKVIVDKIKGTTFVKTIPEMSVTCKQSIDLTKPLTIGEFEDGYCLFNAGANFEEHSF